MFNHIIEIIIFIFGMCAGSFANVYIYRFPLSQSIINPARSFCPNCKAIIRFYDNIPVLSYLWLKARCRHCNQSIPFRYPLVEIICGSFALFTFLKFGFSFECLIYFLFITSLIIITFIDIDHQIIPDIITLPGIPISFLASFALPSLTYKDSLLGLLAGGGSLLIVGWTYSLIKKAEGMGGGDIKLMAMIGAILGWKGVLFTIFIASVTGTLVGIIIIIRTQKDMKVPIPFGPFLSAGAIAYIFFGPDLITWYLGLLI
ncbi:MAG: prepilin peptidase [Deltaproteobacteria bacterium]|nr:prepilin peptidase [Deltaproteobacteria bacterium]MBW2661410.1 prepilin peptidase [Deltaproteobacteria bacterium]